MQPIMDLSEQSVQRKEAWVYWRWWEQEGLDLEGAKEKAAAESDGEGDKYRAGAAQEETPVRDWRRAY